MFFRQGAWRAGLCVFCFSISAPAMAQYVSLTGGTPATQNFDTLAASGTGTAVPNGWYFVETGTNANTSYAADDGTANSGNTYSFGTTGSSDRAFGTLRSSSLVSTIGALLRNDTSAVVSEIAVSYAGEQWRLGAAGRADTLHVQYSLDATSLSTGTWGDAAALDFSSPVTTGTAGKLNGNLAANRTAISGSISGLNLAPSASVWIRWVDIDVPGADDGLAIDDVSFAIGGAPPVDVPPTVSSTTPSNNATAVALAASLSVTFSEPVTATAPWFTLSCAMSGNHTASVSGGPVTFTLTPSPAFAANETCTWTILASNIVDQDGTPDHLGADYVVAFTTADPANTAPTVVSTLPANNAANVPIASDVRVVFSEAVTTSNAFALACAAAPVTLNETGAGANRTLTPTTVLPAGATCTFTVIAAGVRNGANIALAQDYVATFKIASGTVDGYYAQVNTSSPDQLRCSLHQTIKGHRVYPYSGSGDNTWTILEIAQQDFANPAKMIDIYRNRSYTIGSDRAGTGTGITYNREHTWPNSLGFKNSSLAAYTDTHMLWLADTNQNGSRGNKPYADCPASSGCTELATEVNDGAGGTGQSNWVKGPDGNQGSFEVWNHRKGEAARAMFYMAIRYEGIAADEANDGKIPDLELTDDRNKIVITANTAPKAYMGLLTTLLTWHLQDPPDADELARNSVIQSFQGNRNPFVDHPEWVSRALFESTNPATCVLNTPTDSIFKDGFE